MIYIIIVNWKRYNDTLECLISLANLNGLFSIILVDNETDCVAIESLLKDIAKTIPSSRTQVVHCSSNTNLDAELIYNSGPPQALLRVITLRDNTGYAAANNVGIKVAFVDRNCSGIWLLNNDTVVDPDALIEILQTRNRINRTSIIGSVLLYYDDMDTVQSAGAVMKYYSGKGINLYNGKQYVQFRKIADHDYLVQFVVGAAMFIPAEVVKIYGLLSESYFLYFEEVDYCSRVKSNVGTCVSIKSKVYHKEGIALGTNTRNDPSALSLYYYNRSLVAFTIRHKSRFIFMIAARIILKSLFYLISGDFLRSRAIFRGFIDAIKGKSGVI